MKNLSGLMSKAFVGLILTLPLAVSCFDDSELWEAIDQLEMRVDSLENNLNAQMQMVSDMLSGKKNMVISDCVMNADSSYLVTLSNGTSFTVLPQKASVSSLVSVVVVDGKKYWGTYDAAGVMTPLTDAKGAPIPVDMAINVKVIDGKYYLVAGGNEIMTGYDTGDLVQVFNSCEVHKDASGNVYAMTFDFGSGMKVTVTVDGYKGVLFKQSSVTNKVLSEYFINFGATETFLLDTKGVVDYVMQIPDGWRVTEKVEQVTGDVYVSITAPSKETVALGAAVASGDLKVVSVIEGGKAVVTRLTLSTDPFKTFNISPLKAVIQPYTGVQKFVYGLTLISDFEEDEVLANVNAMLKGTENLPVGYFVSDEALDKMHNEIYPDLQEGGAYMFWTLPAIYSEGDTETEAGFFTTRDMLRTYSLVPMFIDMKVSDVTVLDAMLDLKIIGATELYAGLTVKSDDVAKEIANQINNGVYDKLSNSTLLNYEGPASEFPNPELPEYMEPNTSYVAWVVPVEDGKTEYLASDVTYKEFKTLEVKPGGTLKATVGTSKVDCSSISQTVTCADAAMIYYAYLDDEVGAYNQSFGFNTKWDLIQNVETFSAARGSSIEAVEDELMPETTMWLYAVPVGHDGLCGEFVCKSAKTSSVTFNSLTVNVQQVEVLSTEATFKITVPDGTATDYIYWVGRTADEDGFWTGTCMKKVEIAEKFLAANPDFHLVADVMRANGNVPSDGVLKISGLALNKEHVIVVLAKDATGNYSHAGHASFKTASINLGDNFVKEGSEKWNETKKWIEDKIVWLDKTFRDDGEYAYYSFKIKIPQELTASISTSYPEDFNPEGAGMDDTILAFEKYCSNSRSTTLINGYELSPNEQERFNLVDADGTVHNATVFMQISEYYAHGVPAFGRFTYFSSLGHNSTTCSTWNGVCVNYHEQEQLISEKMDVQHWIDWVKNEWYSETYGRVFNDEEKIKKFAEGAVSVYKTYYKDKHPIVYVNDGSAQTVINANATGLDEDGKTVLDKVFIILKDNNGNYYAPMIIDVPNFF